MKHSILSCLVASVVLSVHGLNSLEAVAPEGVPTNGDVNCDGRIDVSDAVHVLLYLYRGGDRPCPVNDPPELLARIEQLEEQNQQLEEQIGQLEEQNATCATNLAESEDSLAATELILSDHQSNLTIALSSLGIANQRITDLESQLSSVESQLNQSQAERAQCGQDLDTSLAANASLNATLQATESDLLASQAELGVCEAELSNTNPQLAECVSDLATTEGSLAVCDSDLQSTQNELATVEVELAQTTADLTQCNNGLIAAQDRIAQLEITGCTDPDAFNFSCSANIDDGSCVYSGCTDPEAENYDPNATVDDGSCLTPNNIPGCTIIGDNEQGYSECMHDQTGIVFVLLPGGEFEMGSPNSEPNRASNEGPVHTVTLSPFMIAKYEVTQAEYAAVMADPPGLSANPSKFAGDDRPVEQVSRDDLKDAGGFLARTGLSLPSEAQWEYAARGGTQTAFSFGDECNANSCDPCGTADAFMWWCGNSENEAPHPVGEKQPNPFGLHDMHGNVWEWCEDWYQDDFYQELVGAGGTAIDPVCENASSGLRVRRGGGGNPGAGAQRSARRDWNFSWDSYYGLGFRPCRLLP